MGGSVEDGGTLVVVVEGGEGTGFEDEVEGYNIGLDGEWFSGLVEVDHTLINLKGAHDLDRFPATSPSVDDRVIADNVKHLIHPLDTVQVFFGLFGPNLATSHRLDHLRILPYIKFHLHNPSSIVLSISTVYLGSSTAPSFLAYQSQL